MSGKVKMRCARCGKTFKSSGAKQTLCSDCEAKVRQERAASKAAGPKVANPAPVQVAAPKIVGPGASILVPGLVSTETAVPPEVGTLGNRHSDRAVAETHARPGQPQRQPLSAHPAHGHAAQTGAHKTPGMMAAHEKQSRPVRQEGQKQQPRVQREPRQPKPPVPAVELTVELRQKIEDRYLELANPVEFDGIRTQIAGELGVPRALVKKAVLELRGRIQMPSWWELQSYTGGNSDLERIRRAYVPHLPVPEIGIHKTIAAELGLDPGVVYQGIKRIRGEMHLPRFNPPELHEAGNAVEGQEAEPTASAGVNDTEMPVSAPGSEAS